MSDLRSQASTWRTSRHTWLVHSDAANKDFSFKVSGAFTIIGRGTILVGDIESGLMRSGDSLEVCDEQGVIFVGAATVDFVCRPGGVTSGIVALVFRDLDRETADRAITVRHRREPSDQRGGAPASGADADQVSTASTDD